RTPSAIAAKLNRSSDDFTVIDTGSIYDLRKLSDLHRDTPILDPFPGRGEYYRDFHNHIAARGCRYVVAGLQPGRDVLRLGLCDGTHGDAPAQSSLPPRRTRDGHVGPALDTAEVWKTAAQAASIGIFVLLLIAFLELARAVLLPILTALVIATMFGPVSNRAARHHVPHWLFATLTVILLIVLLNAAIVLLSSPII